MSCRAPVLLALLGAGACTQGAATFPPPMTSGGLDGSVAADTGASSGPRSGAGTVQISQLRTPEPGTLVNAYFVEGASGRGADAPGACRFIRQTVQANAPQEPVSMPNPYVSAGLLELSGSPGPAIAIEQIASSGYRPYQEKAARWSADQEIRIAAHGGVVPAFSTTLAMPAEVTLGFPLHGMELARDADLTVRWTVVGTSGQVGISASQSQGAGVIESTTVYCVANARDGAFTIPAAQLAQLLPPSQGSHGVLSLGVSNGKVVRSGGFAVDVLAWWASGGPIAVVWK